MARLSCVIWMLGFPLSDAFTCWIQVQAGVHRAHPEMSFGGALMILTVWLGVGALLYRRSA